MATLWGGGGGEQGLILFNPCEMQLETPPKAEGVGPMGGWGTSQLSVSPPAFEVSGHLLSPQRAYHHATLGCLIKRAVEEGAQKGKGDPQHT